MLKKDTRGMSAIVTTVILVALALVAIGIVWVVFEDLIQGQADQADIGEKCLSTDFEITSVDYDSTENSTTIIKRTSGNDEIGGVKVVFESDSGSNSTTSEGNLEIAESETIEFNTDGFENATKVTVTAYFNVEGVAEPQYCSSPADEYEL